MRPVRASIRVAVLASLLACLGCGDDKEDLSKTSTLAPGESPTEISSRKAAEDKVKPGVRLLDPGIRFPAP